MSINKLQIDSLIKRNCGIESINTTSYTVGDMTADENLAIDKVLSIIFKVGGKWQFDDSGHSDYPEIVTSVDEGKRDYSFVVDGAGNLILDIYKVMIKVGTGANDAFVELKPVDKQSDEGMESFYNGIDTTGIPSSYDKTANGIFLNCIPPYTVSGGLKVFINREGSYFLVSDTTKKPGFAGLYHEYVALRPSHFYCKRKSKFALADRYEKDMMIMEEDIRKHYRDRSKDEQVVLSGEYINSI